MKPTAKKARSSKSVAAMKSAKPDPGPRNQQAIVQAAKLYEQRPVRVSVKYEPGPNGTTRPASPHSDEVGHMAALVAAFGSTSHQFMAQNLADLELATRDRGNTAPSDNRSSAALALIGAIDPKDELEAALAVQIASCHSLTMDLIGRAKNTSDAGHLERYANLATKMQRTFTAQIEALGRMRGKGQQTVRVEHVTVQSGAQAIVGSVHHHAPGVQGGKLETEDRPHESGETAFTAQERPALPSPHSQGHGVPITSDAKRPVPAPRRTVARRPRKSKRS